MEITRLRKGKKYNYYLGDKQITDNKVIDRINKLAIPPAWRKVAIAQSATAKIQARGYDSAGRLQSIYHPTFRLKQDKIKFERTLQFAQALPKLRRQVEKDLKRRKLDKDKVSACVIKLIDQEFFRVGNERYAQENQSYGITTLRSKHADITTTTVTFDFVGKSGKEHVKTIRDKQLTRIIKQLDEMPGYEIFRYQDEAGKLHNIDSQAINDYIKRYMGDDFTAKDFRTWGGTLLATSALIQEEYEPDLSQSARAKLVSGVVKQVAKKLGNTPAIARSSYIDPQVFAAYEDGVTLPKLKKAMIKMRPKKYLSRDEQCVLHLLAGE